MIVYLLEATGVLKCASKMVKSNYFGRGGRVNRKVNKR